MGLFFRFSMLSVEKREILSHWRVFSQINYLVVSFVKPSISRNFLRKKCEREFLQFPYCDALRNSLLSFFWKKFVKSTVSFLKCFHEIFFKWVYPPQCGKDRNSLSPKKFCQIISLLTYLASETVTFTKFLPKMRERIPS